MGACVHCGVGKHSASCCPLDNGDNSRWTRPLSVTGCECHDACDAKWARDHLEELMKDGTITEATKEWWTLTATERASLEGRWWEQNAGELRREPLAT